MSFSSCKSFILVLSLCLAYNLREGGEGVYMPITFGKSHDERKDVDGPDPEAKYRLLQLTASTCIAEFAQVS